MESTIDGTASAHQAHIYQDCVYSTSRFYHHITTIIPTVAMQKTTMEETPHSPILNSTPTTNLFRIHSTAPNIPQTLTSPVNFPPTSTFKPCHHNNTVHISSQSRAHIHPALLLNRYSLVTISIGTSIAGLSSAGYKSHVQAPNTCPAIYHVHPSI